MLNYPAFPIKKASFRTVYRDQIVQAPARNILSLWDIFLTCGIATARNILSLRDILLTCGIAPARNILSLRDK